MILYGSETTIVAYKDGVPVGSRKKVDESHYVTSRQEFFDQILAQLDNLKEFDCIEFKVYADKETRNPCRIVTTKEVIL